MDKRNPHSAQSVVYRSPFRYPGGKSWLTPHVRAWIASQPSKPRLLVEPFAGGGSIALAAAFEDLADEVLMVELDDQVASVWEAILNGHGEWLAKRVERFSMSRENVEQALSRSVRLVHTRAFQALLRNRVSHSGILAPGAGLLRQGENERGIGSRWYPTTLRRRIEDIVAIKDRVRFVKQDGLAVMRRHESDPDTVFFIDPPYVNAVANRLYRFGSIDHSEVFRVAASLKGDLLMSYDDNQLARELANTYGLQVAEVSMKSAHHSRKTELLIGRGLQWFRDPIA